MKANNSAKPGGQETSTVMRHISPNSALPAVTPTATLPAFQSIPEFVEAYTTTDKTIVDLTARFVEAADQAKL